MFGCPCAVFVFFFVCCCERSYVYNIFLSPVQMGGFWDLFVFEVAGWLWWLGQVVIAFSLWGPAA
jgi:hypothetical protein